MSFYVYVAEDGQQTYPLTLTDLRRMQPNVSFPAQISDEDAATFGFYAAQQTPRPEGQFQTVESSAVLVDGVWIEEWTVTPWTQEAILVATENQWMSIRTDRNKRLADCDWTQLTDAPISNTEAQNWASYRQALRDITTQSEPFHIQWPDQPGA